MRTNERKQREFARYPLFLCGYCTHNNACLTSQALLLVFLHQLEGEGDTRSLRRARRWGPTAGSETKRAAVRGSRSPQAMSFFPASPRPSGASSCGSARVLLPARMLRHLKQPSGPPHPRKALPPAAASLPWWRPGAPQARHQRRRAGSRTSRSRAPAAAAERRRTARTRERRHRPARS
jgi:hypothetical protein